MAGDNRGILMSATMRLYMFSVYVDSGDDYIIDLFYSFDCSVPCSRIITICLYVFFNREMLIGTMPIDICGIGKVSAQALGILF